MDLSIEKKKAKHVNCR